MKRKKLTPYDLLMIAFLLENCGVNVGEFTSMRFWIDRNTLNV